MNDIEVLEELRKELALYADGEKIKQGQALENLLKERQSDKERIKDLEEINEAHKKENGELREELESVKEIYYTQKEIETNYIPKSKIREMLEELKEIKRVQENNPFTSPSFVYIKELEYGIQILEELLEGE